MTSESSQNAGLRTPGSAVGAVPDGSPRYDTAVRVLHVAFALMATRAGLTIDEIRCVVEPPMGRRTAERVRSAVERLFPGLELVGEGTPKRWRIVPARPLSPPVTLDERDALSLAAKALRRDGLEPQAELLDMLGRRLAATAPEITRRVQEPDLEVLIEGEAFAARPGPREEIPPRTLDAIRRGLLTSRRVSFRYESRATGRSSVQVQEPHGILFGSRPYLVACSPDEQDWRLWALSHMDEVAVTATPFVRRPDFDLRAFAARSFGVFQEEPEDVVLRFSREAVRDARRFRFHPDQSVEDLGDAVVVRFRAGGLQEMAWHLVQWGRSVEVLAPARLREVLARTAADALANLSDDVAGPAGPQGG